MIPYPDCTVCHDNRGMVRDNGWRCTGCGSTWDQYGENGQAE